MSDRKIKRLGKANLEIQSRFSATAEIKEILIKYNGSERNIILVKKRFEIADETHGIVLEDLPGIEDIVFISDVVELGDGLYEVNVGGLDDGELIYYVDGGSSINEMKDGNSILFHEFPASSLGITGYFSFVGDIGDSSAYIVLILFVVGLVGYAGYKNAWVVQMGGWKKEENVRNVIACIRGSQSAINYGDTNRAKDHYHKIKEVFGLLPEGFRKHTYVKIEEIRVALDKAEIAELVKEYEANKRTGNGAKANALYRKIQGKYKRLPKKYQERVYRRLFSNNFRM